MKKQSGKHLRKKVIAGNTVEYSKYYSGMYKKKVQRLPVENQTEDRIRRWQDKRAEDKCRYAIHCNFGVGDIFAKLGYPAWTRKTSEEIRKDIKEFLRELRKLFKRANKVLKYIFTVGRTKRGVIHLHWNLYRI